MILRMIAVFSLILTLSSCALFKREVEIVTVEVPIKVAQPVYPSPVNLRDPKWFVVSEENLDEFLVEIENVAGTVVFFAMTPADYELMAFNIQELRRYILEMNEVVLYYREATLSDEEKDK